MNNSFILKVAVVLGVCSLAVVLSHWMCLLSIVLQCLYMPVNIAGMCLTCFDIGVFNYLPTEHAVVNVILSLCRLIDTLVTAIS